MKFLKKYFILSILIKIKIFIKYYYTKNTKNKFDKIIKDFK